MRKIFCKDCGKKYGFYQEFALGVVGSRPMSPDELKNQVQRREIRRAKVRKEAEEEGLELIEFIDSKSFRCPKGHKLSLNDEENSS